MISFSFYSTNVNILLETVSSLVSIYSNYNNSLTHSYITNFELNVLILDLNV